MGCFQKNVNLEHNMFGGLEGGFTVHNKTIPLWFIVLNCITIKIKIAWE